jgi:5-methylcytosine-specific restriction endonuclease McrA
MSSTSGGVISSSKEREKHNRQLLSKSWQRKRNKILIRAMNICEYCKKTECLEVHHLYYIIGNNIWDYPDNALIVLCRECHQKWHDEYKIEYREKEWTKNKPYQAPKIGQSKKKYRSTGTATPVLSKLEKAKRRIRKRGIFGGKFRTKNNK